ncbi:hypothetical protein GCM10020220_108120 [Nonomuraea rubra]|uniref:hypothetical protein n=1 Tax=Nonomuraea rubra TaxID=46180 RepID=UPI0031E5CF72
MAARFLFYLAQLALVLQLAVMRRVKAWMHRAVLLDLALLSRTGTSIPLGGLSCPC